MPVLTLRPTRTVNNNAQVTTGTSGQTTAHGVTADNNDSSGVELLFNQEGQARYFTVGFTAPSLPAGSVITSVTPRLRHNNNKTDPNKYFIVIPRSIGIEFPAEPVAAHVTLYSERATQTGIARSALPNGAPWSVNDVGAVELYVLNNIAESYMVTDVYLDVAYSQPATASGSAPNGVSTVTRPIFHWTFSDPENDQQVRFRVKVVPASVATQVGFDPNTYTAWVADSGEQFSDYKQWTCNTDLQNNVTYRAYIWVMDAGSGQWSTVTATTSYAWARIDTQAPAIPSLDVYPDASTSSVRLVLTGRDNLLTANMADVETDNVGFSAVNATFQRTANASDAYTGAAHGGVQCTVAGTVQLIAGKAPIAQGGTAYSASAAVRPLGTTPRMVTCYVRFFDAGGTFISQVAGPTVSEAAQLKWMVIGVNNAVAPSNARQVDIMLQWAGVALNETHHFDGLTIYPSKAANLAKNAMLDNDKDGDGLVDHWTLVNATADPNPSMSTAEAPAGLFSGPVQRMVITTNTARKGLQQNDLPLVAGATYRCSIWVHSTKAGSARLVAGGIGTVTTSVAANTWQLVSLAGTFAGGTDRNLYTDIDVADATVHFTDAQFVCTSQGSVTYDPATDFLPNDWSRGGLLAAQRFRIERSTDQSTWTTVARTIPLDLSTTDVSDTTQAVEVYDYEAPTVVPVYYRAVVTATQVNVGDITSRPSVTRLVNLPSVGWRLQSTVDPTIGTQLNIHNVSLAWQSEERQSVHYAIGRSNPIVLSDVVGGETLPAELAFTSESSYREFEALRARRETLLLRSTYGDVHYVRIGAARTATHLMKGGGDRKYIVSVTFIEVDAA